MVNKKDTSQTIVIKKSTKKELLKFRRGDETFNSIVLRLIDIANNVEEQQIKFDLGLE